MNLYDLLGLLAPVTKKYRFLPEELRTSGLTWDDSVPMDPDENAKEVFKDIINDPPVELGA